MKTQAEVAVVIATRNRPEMLRQAITSVREQQVSGGVEIIVVFDQSAPDTTLEEDNGNIRVRVISNTRATGLAGARNSGIAAASAEFVAFCDDDDYWNPGKLEAQIAMMREHPEYALVGCGITIEYADERHDRVLGTTEITLGDLVRDRLTELHPSTFLFRAKALRDDIGDVSEEVPGGFGEDYELLLRTARHGPIGFVREPLTVVRWHGTSFFFRRWEIMSQGLSHVLEKFPEFRSDRRGYARIQGQIAFAEAAGGNWKTALKHVSQSARSHPLEPRPYLALLVTTRLVKPAHVLSTLHRFGRGI